MTVRGRDPDCKHKFKRARDLEGKKQGAIWHKVKRCKLCKHIVVVKFTKLNNR